MKSFRFWSTTQFKVITLLSFFFIIISSAMMILSFHLHSQALTSTISSSAEHLNQSLQSSLELAMLSGNRKEIQSIIERISADQHIINLFVTNEAGEIRAASKPELLQQPIDGGDSCSRALHNDSPVTHSSFLFESDQGQVLRTVTLIHNKPACHACHDPGAQYNGALYLDYSMAPYQAQIKRQKQLAIFLGAAVVLALAVLSFSFLNRMVLTRIKNLASRIQMIGLGQPDQLRETDSQDEFAILDRSIQQMEQRIQESMDRTRKQRDFLQKIIDSVQDGLIVIDEHFNITLANEAFRRFTGKSSEEIVGRPCSMALGRDICERRKGNRACPSAAAFRSQAEAHSTHVYFEGSQKKLLEISAFPLIREPGQPQQTIELIRDITEKKQLEDELLQSAKMASIGRLAAGIAHEINTPLATIATRSEGLYSRLKEAGQSEGGSDWMTTYFESIDKCVFRCQTIIDRLLMFSHRTAESKVPVDLNAIIHEATSLISHRVRDEHKNMELDLAASPLMMAGEQTQIEQLVINLLTNGLDAIPANGSVKIHTWEQNGTVTMVVEDNGKGIPESDIEKIFDPFFTTKKVGKGTGLGLSICQKIVSEHGGKMRVTSEPNRGARFEITFKKLDGAATEVMTASD